MGILQVFRTRPVAKTDSRNTTNLMMAPSLLLSDEKQNGHQPPRQNKRKKQNQSRKKNPKLIFLDLITTFHQKPHLKNSHRTERKLHQIQLMTMRLDQYNLPAQPPTTTLTIFSLHPPPPNLQSQQYQVCHHRFRPQKTPNLQLPNQSPAFRAPALTI